MSTSLELLDSLLEKIKVLQDENKTLHKELKKLEHKEKKKSKKNKKNKTSKQDTLF